MSYFIRTSIGTAVLLAVLVAPSAASMVTYAIKDLGNYPSIVDMNTSGTFSGTGFVGILQVDITAKKRVSAFGHFFGLSAESTPTSTLAQLDISELKDKAIESAILCFDLKHGTNSGPASATVTSLDTDGVLGFEWDPRTNLGTVNAEVKNFETNFIDVTKLLRDRVNERADWFGLHLKAASGMQMTITDPRYRLNPDSANVRLMVEYSDSPTTVHHNPEPSTLVIWGLLGAAFVFGRRRLLA